jgi:transmembrane sensor
VSLAVSQDPAVRARRIRAEAAVWVAWLHGPDRTPELEAALRRWLAESRAHEVAFNLASDALNDPARLLATRPRTARHPLRPLLVIVTACLVISVVSHEVFRRVPDISTAIGERRSVTLPDGTAVQLNTSSRVLIQYDKQARRVILETGEVYFNVAKSEPRPFIVVAGDRKVIATGTSFVVRREESVDIPLTVSLIEGRVAVAPASSANVVPLESSADVTVMSAGQRARFRRAGPPTMDTPPLETVPGWTSGLLNFDSTPLPEAVAEVNRYSQTQIVISFPEEQAAKISVNGLFQTEDPLGFARTIAASEHLNLVPHGTELLLERP